MKKSIFKEHQAPVLLDIWKQPNQYIPTPLPDKIALEYLVSIHYFEYASDFYFPGESHDFWEFLYVDKGEVCVKAGEHESILKCGEIIFHRPLEFHSLRANGLIAPNLVVASFGCQSPDICFFEGKILTLRNPERELLAQAVGEAQEAFSSPLGDPALFQLEKRPHIPFGAEQMIKVYLEQLLIRLIRRNRESSASALSAGDFSARTAPDTFNQIVLYLKKHLHDSLTLDAICRENFISRSNLQKVFQDQYSGGVMEYFSALKMDAAKEAIRQGGKNFTEIAQMFGFSSVHYFSRRFKKLTGMSPSEYAASVKGISERALW